MGREPRVPAVSDHPGRATGYQPRGLALTPMENSPGRAPQPQCHPGHCAERRQLLRKARVGARGCFLGKQGINAMSLCRQGPLHVHCARSTTFPASFSWSQLRTGKPRLGGCSHSPKCDRAGSRNCLPPKAVSLPLHMLPFSCLEYFSHYPHILQVHLLTQASLFKKTTVLQCEFF